MIIITLLLASYYFYYNYSSLLLLVSVIFIIILSVSIIILIIFITIILSPPAASLLASSSASPVFLSRSQPIPRWTFRGTFLSTIFNTMHFRSARSSPSPSPPDTSAIFADSPVALLDRCLSIASSSYFLSSSSSFPSIVADTFFPMRISLTRCSGIASVPPTIP